MDICQVIEYLSWFVLQVKDCCCTARKAQNPDASPGEPKSVHWRLASESFFTASMKAVLDIMMDAVTV